MMNDKQYNDFFRKKLDEFSSEVPDYLWQNISNKNLQQQNRFTGKAKYAIVLLFMLFTFYTADELIKSDNKNLPQISLTKSDKTETAVADKQQQKRVDELNIDKTILINNNLIKNDVLFTKNNKKKKIINRLDVKTKTLSINKINQNSKTKSPELKSYKNQNNDSTVSDIKRNAAHSDSHKNTDSAAAITVDDNQTSQRFFLYVFASPDMPFAHVSAADKNYQSLRNNQASPQLSYSAGARLRINISSRLSGNIGVQYSQVNEKIQLQNKISFNHYKSLNVPVLVGFQVYKNKFAIDVNAGIILNISASYKGYISSLSGEPVNIKTAAVYKNNTALSYYGSLQFVINPTHKTSFFAEPYFRYQPQNIANAFQPFQEKIQSAGLMLGARYRFNK